VKMYQQINLYQPIFRKQRQIFAAATMLQVVGVVALALLGIYVYAFAQVGALEAAVVQLEGREKALLTQLTRIDPALGANRRAELDAEVRRLNATLLDQQRLIDVLRDQPLGGVRGFSGYLSALARQRTPELWLTEIGINGGTAAIELAGRSLSAELVPEYMQRLGAEPALAGQQFDSFAIELDGESGESTFRATSRAALRVADNGEARP
jgi:Tfp pilus assembly protein PilN